MKRKLITVCCWIMGALAVCLVTAAVRSGPIGFPAIALGFITAVFWVVFASLLKLQSSVG